MKIFVVLIALLSSVSAFAEDWVLLSANTKNTIEYYGLKNSVVIRTNKNGDQIVSWTEKEVDKNSNQITLQKLYVKTSDCLQKLGKGVIVNMDGDFRYDYDFAFGLGTVGGVRAEMLCGIYNDRLAAAKGKSL